MKKHARYAATLAILLITLLGLARLSDPYSTNYTDTALKDATVTYAIVRGMNGAISVLQGTEVGVPGVTITIGEVLDPVNDLIERFSWVVMLAMASLGIQSLLATIGASMLFNLLLGISAVLLIATLWLKSLARHQLPALKVFAVVAFIRFALVGALLINQAVDHYFLQQRQQVATEQLESAKQILSRASQQSQPAQGPEQPGFLDSLKSAWGSFSESVKLERVTEAAEQSVDSVIELTVLFLLRTVLLPVGLLWAGFSLLKALLRYTPPGR